LVKEPKEKQIRLKIHLKAKIIELFDTIDSCADVIGVSPEGLSKICHERCKDVSGSTMLKLARVLKMHPDEIWELLRDPLEEKE
jgi:plasmid maintenance system antidote protein VapI